MLADESRGDESDAHTAESTGVSDDNPGGHTETGIGEGRPTDPPVHVVADDDDFETRRTSVAASTAIPINVSNDNGKDEDGAEHGSHGGLGAKRPKAGCVERGTSTDDDTRDGCSICWEPWTSGGEHRVCALRCGHLYGHSCIERWLTKAGNNSCPSCKRPSSKRDIVVLYVARLTAVDTTETDALREQLRAEKVARAKIQEGEAHLKLKYEAVRARLALLEEQIRHMEAAQASAMETLNVNNARFVRTVNFEPSTHCRGISFDPHLQLFAVGVSRDLHSGRNFGLAKISVIDGGRVDYVAGLHSQVVKALACSPSGDGNVLTTSFDRTLKLSSLSTKAVLLSYTLDAPGWSCAFHPSDRNLLFAGLSNGTVSIFDVRNTKGAMCSVPVPSRSGDAFPIHSLNIAPADCGYRLAAANCQSPVIVDVNACGTIQRVVYPEIPGTGQCSSFLYDGDSATWTAAMRGRTCHHVFGTVSEEEGWKMRWAHACEAAQASMTRSSLLPHDSQSILAMPDGSSGRIALMGPAGECVESGRLATNSGSPVLDAVLARVDKTMYAGLLSERQLSLFAW